MTSDIFQLARELCARPENRDMTQGQALRELSRRSAKARAAKAARCRRTRKPQPVYVWQSRADLQ